MKYYVIAIKPHKPKERWPAVFISRGMCREEVDKCYQSLSPAYAEMKIVYGTIMDKAHFDRHSPEANDED